MYERLKHHLTNGDYTVSDATWRISFLVAKGYLSEEQTTELQTIADARARADDEQSGEGPPGNPVDVELT